MGCDIWAFVEYGFDSGGYESIFQGSIWLQRNYQIFAALAGVRNRDNKPPLYPARGLPKDVSSAAFEGYYSYVIDRKDVELWTGFSFSMLDKLRNFEKSTLIPPDEGRGLMRSKHGYLANSDFHTPSWLKLSEVINALEYHGIDLNEMPSEYQVMLDVMSSIKRRGVSKSTRLVFWFSG
jgi:hypothetical protein